MQRCAVQMLLLAGPGVLISTFCLGASIKIIFPYNWSWSTSLLLGGLLSATDPVAVVALLKELGASKKLRRQLLSISYLRMVLGWTFNWGAVIKLLVQVSLGEYVYSHLILVLCLWSTVGVGIAFGIASVLWLGFIFNDTVIKISLTLAVSYVAYFTVCTLPILHA
ncbi:hypothetical protein RND71_007217 [Anisodus tanguticus]|uniref:Cation/H+ exchanger transmembrane domain-containing protein n=1 Tax=Anisodus tanguticus TaxID=243964 RepID=A0AAE1SIN3_9SOLA|nr:hypothetical protein RND71_007217 [Anisodus tanguticus]